MGVIFCVKTVAFRDWDFVRHTNAYIEVGLDYWQSHWLEAQKPMTGQSYNAERCE
jgi:hypothetical protein